MSKNLFYHKYLKMEIPTLLLDNDEIWPLLTAK